MSERPLRERQMSSEPRPTTARATGGAGIIRTLLLLYSAWTTPVMNAAFFAAYYLFFYELIVRANFGYFLLTIPLWLLVLFVLASSTLATVAVSYLRISLQRRRGIPGIAGSPVGVVVGAFVASCACNLPLVAPLLYFIGLNSLEVSGVISFLAAYQQAIVEAIVLINLVSIYYYLRQISRSGPVRKRSVNNTVNRTG